jgi:hypothetical protein
MFIGAVGGAALILHKGPALPLAISAGLAAITGVVLRFSRARRFLAASARGSAKT